MALEPELFAERYLRRDRHRGGRRRRRLPVRPAAAGRPRPAATTGLRDPRGAAGTGCLLVGDPPRPARGRRRSPRRRCSGGRTSSTASSSAATSAAARSATRRRTSRSSRTWSCPPSGSTPAAALGHRAAALDRYEPALRRHGAPDRALPARLRGRSVRQRLVVEVWERLRDEAAFVSEDELVAQIGRDVEATRAAGARARRREADSPVAAGLSESASAGSGARASASGLTTPIGSPAANASTCANASPK